VTVDPRQPGREGRGSSTARLVAVAVLAFLLFNHPFLAVFDVPERVLGLPVLWAYLLGIWACVLALVAWVSRSG
jgi:hypothetical protein